ncbi:sigma 54-interacting transcriptional regulator [bacterium]|nr:sigma 54-interacting transcriptional regulator [bacterium]
MEIDERDFFKEATLKICGSLEIEKAMWQCLLYIRRFIPASQMNLHIYDQTLGIVETVAHATRDGGEMMSLKTSFSPQSRKSLEELRSIRLRTYSNPADREILREFVSKLAPLGLTQDLEFIFLDLVLERSFIGVLSVVFNQGETVLPIHSRLLRQLNEPFSIALSNSLRYREVRDLQDRLADDNRYFQGELRRLSGEEVIGGNYGLRGVMEMSAQVALLDSPVLLMGETGVGKEVVAGAIHNMSPRRKGPFIKVNCGAIPESLMDSELFGHEKGAFTGAIALKRGRFERAQGGTVFLDEIGELSPEAQVKLLRVIQEKEIERLGGTRTLQVDIRIIAATHRDLDAMLLQNRFREDLYYRLKVFPIIIPPLRERLGDIPMLVQHFIQKKGREMKRLTLPTLAPGAIDSLLAYHWPGNVRELENMVERAMILGRDGMIHFDPLHLTLQARPQQGSPTVDGLNLNLNLAIARQIRKALEISKGRVHGKQGAAELLGINAGTLRHKMRKLGIPFGRKTRMPPT